VNLDSSGYYLLEQLCTHITDGTHQTPTYQNEGIAFISARNIKDGRLDFSDTRYISQDEHSLLTKSTAPRAGDLLLTKSGSLGDVAVVPELNFEFSIFESLALLRPRRDLVDPRYLYHYIRSPESAKYFHGITTGLAVKHLHLGDLRKLRVFLPPLVRQREISERLSTWDTAIQKTEQLIAAKEQLYIALINRLIKNRSKYECWPNIRIFDIADRIQRQGDGGEYPLLTISSASGFVRQEDRYSRYMAGESAKTYTLLRAGEFAYNKGNSKRYEFGCVIQLRDYAAALVPSIYVCFRLHDSICAAYLRHLLIADYLKPQLRALVKTGVRNNGLLNIRPDEFMGTTVPLPPLEQQVLIANALDAVSAEIGLLKQQLTSLRAQKRGLMQKLLTGEWRLPLPGGEGNHG
jgi:type I restriction enzyme S subunit